MKETKFKQTELGMIPSDWEVKTLGSLTDKCSYGVGAEARVYCGDVKYIRITDIDDESHRFSPSPITSPSFFQEKHIVQKNDLLVARTGASVGKSYLYDEKDGKLVYAGFLMKLNVFNADSKYVFYNTLTKSYWNWVASESARTGQPGLNLQQMKLYSIALPPTIKEQQRIANALSDVDSLIANLEKLIAKKKNIKQGAMQQLLTGKKRLPGFGSDERTGSRPTDERRKECHSERSAKREVEESSGYKMTELGLIPSDWEVKKVGSIGKIITGSTPPRGDSTLWNGTFCWLSAQDFKQKNIFNSVEKISELGKKYCRLLPKDSVLVTCIASIGLNAISRVECATNQQINAIVCNDKNNPNYIYYAIEMRSDDLKVLAGQTAVPIVNKEQFENFELILPSKAEQTAIANVLSDMDTEISALETKLAKYRTLKTGMMQQLLTGKIRIV